MSTKRAFFWHIFPSYLLLILLTCLGIIFISIRVAGVFHRELTVTELKRQAILLETVFHQKYLYASPSPTQIDSLCKVYAELLPTRITFMDLAGVVLGDSKRELSGIDNHRDRPEFQAALKGDTGTAVRFSESVKRELVYVAIPVVINGSVVAVIRTAMPLDTISAVFKHLSVQLLLTGLIGFILSVALSLFISRRLSRPLVTLTDGAQRLSTGDFSVRLTVPDTLETARLAEALNKMARDLADRIATVTRKSHEQEAVLSAMVEGVVAVDTDERILMINEAASSMLGVRGENVAGRSIQECVRNAVLQKFMLELLGAKRRIDREMTVMIAPGCEKALEIHGTVLRGEQGSIKGVVAAMHDVTHLKKLENIRRDFVANVSHELRTPLTSIKGFVETLLDGAMEVPADRERFLKIIEEHVNRLNTLIGDLLTISRLEKDDIQDQIEMSDIALEKPAKAAIKAVSSRALERNISIEMSAEARTVAHINMSLFEQALINLVDNAVKYSDDGSLVRVVCESDSHEVRVKVIDQGMGIAADHIPRVFERFYRVDKARSRKMGGTGLGLSIVKHIVTVHGGQVSVESKLGKGSTFTVHLPLPQGRSI